MSDWEAPLDNLRWHWGSAYLIHFFGPDRWVAQRRDSHATISAETAVGLLDLIRQDYSARPVSRQTGPDRPQAPERRFRPEG